MFALTREPSTSLSAGERTHIDRLSIDHELALQQHRGYEAMLRDEGVHRVSSLDVEIFSEALHGH